MAAHFTMEGALILLLPLTLLPTAALIPALVATSMLGEAQILPTSSTDVLTATTAIAYSLLKQDPRAFLYSRWNTAVQAITAVDSKACHAFIKDDDFLKF
jgi:hypothetical protein